MYSLPTKNKTLKYKTPVKSQVCWWISEPNNRPTSQQSQRESKPYSTLLQHASFHCYNRIVETERPWLEKLIWLVLHALALGILLQFLWRTQIKGVALQINLVDPLYSVQESEFPILNFCTMERISGPAAWKYAQNLNEIDPLKRGIEYFYRQIEYFQLFYNYENSDIDLEDIIKFQYFLDFNLMDDNDSYFNTSKLMMDLTPKCEDILLQCFRSNQEFSCKDQFTETLTDYGFCCSFNDYGRLATMEDFQKKFMDHRHSLEIIINTTIVAEQKRNHGDNVLIFVNSFEQYPDSTVSRVNYQIARSGQQLSIIIDSKMFITENDLRSYSPKTRNCYFNDELPHEYGNFYSFNSCITYCRTKSMLALCGCIMFTIPLKYWKDATNAVYCTLRHLNCLQRYQFKWNNILTELHKEETLQRENEDALFCPACLPSCVETTYELSSLELKLNDFLMTDFTQNVSNYKNLLRLQFHYKKPYIELYKQVRKSKTFQVFSNIGNMCSIVTGFSLIGCLEVLYFMCLQLYKKWNSRLIKVVKNRKKKMSQEDLIILP